MRAILYAAGVGNRLGGSHDGPKILLEFDGHSLLERHLRLLAACGVDDIVLCTGHEAETIAAAVQKLGWQERVRCVHNPDFREGSIVTQWAAREAIAAGGPVLLMDADVLYDQRLLARLIDSPHADCFLLDRDIEPGEEPVKLCIREGHLVDFRKNPDQRHDWYGESVGFFKLAEKTAARLVASTAAYIESGRRDDYYDEALRDLLLADPPGSFGFEDITGLPWTELDFAEDVARARTEILPRLEPLPPLEPAQ
jgi:choline kinase